MPRVGVVRCNSELAYLTHHTVNMSNQGFFFESVSSTQFSFFCFAIFMSVEFKCDSTQLSFFSLPRQQFLSVLTIRPMVYMLYSPSV